MKGTSGGHRRCEASTILEKRLGRSGEKFLGVRKVELISMRGVSSAWCDKYRLRIYISACSVVVWSCDVARTECSRQRPNKAKVVVFV